MYTKIKNLETKVVYENIIKRISDEACIPKDPDNRDYQEYLEWVAKGNKASEADEN